MRGVRRARRRRRTSRSETFPGRPFRRGVPRASRPSTTNTPSARVRTARNSHVCARRISARRSVRRRGRGPPRTRSSLRWPPRRECPRPRRRRRRGRDGGYRRTGRRRAAPNAAHAVAASPSRPRRIRDGVVGEGGEQREIEPAPPGPETAAARRSAETTSEDAARDRNAPVHPLEWETDSEAERARETDPNAETRGRFRRRSAKTCGVDRRRARLGPDARSSSETAAGTTPEGDARLARLLACLEAHPLFEGAERRALRAAVAEMELRVVPPRGALFRGPTRRLSVRRRSRRVGRHRAGSRGRFPARRDARARVDRSWVTWR